MPPEIHIRDTYIVYIRLARFWLVQTENNSKVKQKQWTVLNSFILSQWNPVEKVLVPCTSAIDIRKNLRGNNVYIISYLTSLIFNKHERAIYLILLELKAVFTFGKITAWKHPPSRWVCFFLGLLAERAVCFIMAYSSGELRFVYIFKCLLSFSCT